MDRRKSETIAINALLCTLIIIFTALPIGIGPVRLAVLMLVPVMVAAQTLRFGSALFAGTFLGIASCVTAFIAPSSPVAFALQNPLISIVPRMLVGIITYLIYRGIRACIKNEKLSFSLASSISSVVGVLTNTGFVSLFIWLFYGKTGLQGTPIDGIFMETFILANFVVEIIVCTIITPPISLAVTKVMRRSGGR